MSKTILKAKNLYKTYQDGLWILKDLSLEIKEGETIAILGHSGVGKTTLLNILGALEDPTQGSLEILSTPITRSSVASLRNQQIGFIFQFYHLLEEYTALDNVLLPAQIARKPVSKDSLARTRALMLLDKVGISHRAHFLTKLLSGGEKQRVAIARALCNDPSLILADEPTGNLDEKTAQGIHELLIDCAKTLRKALVIVTHNLDLARLCDQRFLLKEGALHPSD